MAFRHIFRVGIVVGSGWLPGRGSKFQACSSFSGLQVPVLNLFMQDPKYLVYDLGHAV